MLAALALPERSCVLLVSPPDVGKTALVTEVAARLREGTVSPSLKGRDLWRVTANELIAGAQYTGQWQERGRRLVAEMCERRAIVATGDPMAIIAAGRWSRSDNNLDRMLRTHMENGEITLICESDPDQLEALRKQEPSFIDAFHRIDVQDPGPELTHRILASAARRLDAAHGVQIEDAALAATVDLTRRFEPYHGFPGKAVRLLEEAVRLGEARTGRDVVVRTFSARSGLPLALLSDEVQLPPRTVEEHFKPGCRAGPRRCGPWSTWSWS